MCKKILKSFSGVLQTAQVGRCLRVCESPEERRVVAVLFFAGVRPDAEFGEISRLDWAAFGAEVIDVSSEVSKTPSDRHIPISPRLRRLIKGHPADGPVMPSGWKKRWQRIRRDAGIAELIDVARHVYCSNMLAAFGMEACQAAMGHVPLSQVTRRHYARSVLKPAALRYFRLRPGVTAWPESASRRGPRRHRRAASLRGRIAP